jgi:hypothetical protein
MKVNKIKNLTKSGDSIKVTRSLFQGGDGGAIPTSPLQLKIEIIKPQLANFLNSKWHSRLPIIHWSNIVRNTHYICFGLSFDYRWYAVGIWSSPVAQNRFKDGKKILELRRLAICRNAPKNTATRMLSVMIKIIKKRFPDINRLISYQDTQVHSGTIYKAGNWENINKTKFITWSMRNKTHNKDQSTGDKIRWEFNLNN